MAAAICLRSSAAEAQEQQQETSSADEEPADLSEAIVQTPITGLIMAYTHTKRL